MSETLVRDAAEQLQQGRLPEARSLLEQVLLNNGDDADALQLLSRVAFSEKRFSEARELLLRTLEADPARSLCHFDLGGIELEQGNFAQALEHLETADRLLPDHAIIQLHKALALEQLGRDYDAALVYKRCWMIALQGGARLGTLPVPLQRLMAHGRGKQVKLLESMLTEALEQVRRDFDGADLKRVERLIAVIVGKAPREQMPPLQRPGGMYFPGLPERKFFERELFPWMEEVEAHATEIRDEYLALAEDGGAFKPYVSVDEKMQGADHWKGVNNSLNWSSCHVYRHGALRQDVARRCPVTVATLDKAPLNRVPDHGPEAMFSVLKPHTHIPPHHGTINGRVIVHLPLIVPKNCGAIRVAGEVRTWEFGKCLAFDDSYAHEAWNESNETRVVLIFDIWSPFLSDAEIAAFARVIELVDRMNIDALGKLFFRE